MIIIYHVVRDWDVNYIIIYKPSLFIKMPSHKAAFGICDSSMIESIKVSRNGAIGLAAFGGDFTRMP